ncbi:MAG: hypothetical protein ACK56I_24840, partial [bacterium]
SGPSLWIYAFVKMPRSAAFMGGKLSRCAIFERKWAPRAVGRLTIRDHVILDAPAGRLKSGAVLI